MAATLSRTALVSDGRRYRMVDFKSLCPISAWTVLRSIPDLSNVVQYVARNL
jgi:hypothetical protein